MVSQTQTQKIYKNPNYLLRYEKMLGILVIPLDSELMIPSNPENPEVAGYYVKRGRDWVNTSINNVVVKDPKLIEILEDFRNTMVR